MLPIPRSIQVLAQVATTRKLIEHVVPFQIGFFDDVDDEDFEDDDFEDDDFEDDDFEDDE